MSDIFNNITSVHTSADRVCRVAYTLNNAQPVACSIIDEQPLFYMDFETSYEDTGEDLFDAADYGILESELNELKNSIDSFDSFSKSDALSTEAKFDLFLETSSEITSSTDQESSADIEELETILKESRLAASYLECAHQHNVELVFSNQIETALYDRKNGQILINAQINQIDQVFLAVQELRRHFQHRQGALIHPLTFHPDNAILVNRAQSADLIVSVVRAAWELQLSGYKDAWERIENSSFADLGRAFAREAYLDFRTINNGQAMAAVFEAWFLSERCRFQDKNVIDQMLSDHQGYVFSQEQSESAMTPAVIAALGVMPFGKNYLAEHALTIMDDAIFTDVRDRSNANFLWFIKFERTFRETEQELQTCDGSGEDVQSLPSNQTQQGQSNGSHTASSAEIISLSFGSNSDVAEKGDLSEKNSGKKRGRLSAKAQGTRSGDKDDVSNVVYLRSWAGE